MEKEKLKMNLQMFADDSGKKDDPAGGNDPDNTDPNGKEDPEKGEQDDLPSDKEELQEIINNAVEGRVARLEKKHEEELKKVRQKARSDAKKYADMTEEEKKQADIQERLEELEARERELNNRELLTNIKSDLADKGLPIAFADSLLVIQDNEKIKDSINEIKKTWDEEIREAIKQNARQKTPNSSSRSYMQDDKKNKNKAEFFNEGRKI